MFKLTEATLETISGGHRRRSSSTVIQSNFSNISMKGVFVDADTKGYKNDGGFNITVIQTNKN